MATNITLDRRAANMTPDEWLNETAKQRLEHDELAERMHKFAKGNREDIARLGVKPSDVQREIANHRRDRSSRCVGSA